MVYPFVSRFFLFKFNPYQNLNMSKNQKEIRIIALAVGGFYVFFSLYGLFFNKYLTDFFSSPPGSDRNPSVAMMHSFQSLYNNYMPYLAIIGIAFLLFGILYEKIKTVALPVFAVLAISAVVWSLYYSFGAKESFESFDTVFIRDLPPAMDMMKDWMRVAYIISAFFMIAVFTGPQIILGIKVWKDRQPEVLAEA